MKPLQHKKHTLAKRGLSLLCVLALCLGLLPVTALAAEGAPNSLYVGDQQVISIDNVITYWITSTDGKLTKSTDDQSWNVKYDPSTATLSLKNANISGIYDQFYNPYIAGIYAPCRSNQSVALTIELIGTNTITGTYGIFLNAEIDASSYGTNATLTITGENNGSLGVSGSDHGIYVKSGTGNASLTINDVSVVAKTTQTYSGYAGVYVMSSMHATSSPQLSLKVNGGSLTASGTGSNDGILFYVGQSQATGATTSLTVSENAIVDARNGGISASKISETLPTPTPTGDNRSGIVFDGSTGTVYGTVELQNDLTIGAGETLTVPDGSSLNCSGKLTNNGTINVESGGTVSGQLKNGTTVTTPSISDQPTNQTVYEGETAGFSVAASAGDSEPLTYQWQQSTDSGSSWTDISGATSASYTISSTTTSMSDNQYRCVVTSASGVSVISQAATLTVEEKTVPVTGVTLDKTSLSLYTGESATLTATVEPDDATNQNVTWQSNNANVATVQNGTVTAKGAGETTITVQTQDGNHTATCKVTVKSRPSYNPPTVSEKTIDAIADAQPGDTVTVDLSRGSTKLDKEVFEELRGQDITLVIELGDGLRWTINGSDIPENAKLADIDMGVTMNSHGIPADIINAITGEHGSIQLELAHNGAFGFTMTLSAPLGTENSGYWANLYYFNESTDKMTFETAAQIGDDGTASLSFSHASQYAIVIDDHNHGVIELPFTDVNADDWFYEPVCFVYENGLMTGTSADTFEPNTPLSRAMLVAVLHRLEGSPAASGSDFSDVASGDWYAEAVNWAASVGVVNGMGDGSFQPNAAITREQMAAILRNYAAYKGMDVTTSGDLSTYSDAASVSDWAEDSVAWAVEQGLLSGMTVDTLQPQGVSTRAQVAAVLQRALGNVAGSQ